MCQYGHLAIRNQIMAARGNFLVWRTLFKYFQWFHPHWWVDVTRITLQDLFPQTEIISRVCCSLFVAGSCIVRSPHPTLIISGVCSLQCIEGLYCAPIISGLCWSLPRALSNFYRTLLHRLCHDLRFDIKKMCKKIRYIQCLALFGQKSFKLAPLSLDGAQAGIFWTETSLLISHSKSGRLLWKSKTFINM